MPGFAGTDIQHVHAYDWVHCAIDRFLVSMIIVLGDSYHNVYIFTTAVAAADNGGKYCFLTTCRRHLDY